MRREAEDTKSRVGREIGWKGMGFELGAEWRKVFCRVLASEGRERVIDGIAEGISSFSSCRPCLTSMKRESDIAKKKANCACEEGIP